MPQLLIAYIMYGFTDATFVVTCSLRLSSLLANLTRRFRYKLHRTSKVWLREIGETNLTTQVFLVFIR